MRKLISIVVAALFAAVTFSAYAADPAPAGDASKTTKPTTKKKKKSTSSSSSGAVKQGATSTGTAGRGDTPGAASGGAVTTVPTTGAARGDNTGAAAGGAVNTAPQSGPARGDK